MTTSTEPRYLVKINANQLGRPALKNLVEDFPANTDVTIMSVMSESEFQNVMGTDIAMAHFMVRRITVADDWSATIQGADVLTCESNRNIQTKVVRALMPESERGMDIDELEGTFRDYDDISPAALDFLLSLHDEFLYPDEESPGVLADMARKSGIALSDLVKPQEYMEARQDLP